MFTVRVLDRDNNAESYHFAKPDITVGRVAGNDLVLARGSVSKKHARIVLKDGAFYVTDLKSTNGTTVEDQKIAATQLIRAGERVGIGEFLLTFVLDGAPRVAAPEKAPVPAPDAHPSPQSPQTPRTAAGPARAPKTAAMRFGGSTVDDDVDDLIDSLGSAPDPDAGAAAARGTARGGTPIAPVPVVGPTTGSLRTNELAAPGTARLPVAAAPAPATPGPDAPAGPRGPKTNPRGGSSPMGAHSTQPGTRITDDLSTSMDALEAVTGRNFVSRARFEDTVASRGTRSFRLRLDTTGRMASAAEGSGGYELPTPTPPFVQSRTIALASLLAESSDGPEVVYPPAASRRSEVMNRASELLDRIDAAAPVQEADRRTLIRLLSDDVAAVGPVETYLLDGEITAVHALTWDRVYVTRRGRTQPAPYAFGSRDAFVRAVRRIERGRTWSEGAVSELRTADGLVFRVSHADGSAPALFAMREAAPTTTLDDFVSRGSAPPALAALVPQLLRTGAGVAIIATSNFDAAHFARALAARAAATLPVVAGSQDTRLSNLGIGILEPSATFGADVDALAPSVVLFDDVDYTAVSDFLTYPGTRASAWLLPMAAAAPDVVVPQLAAAIAQAGTVAEQTARELALARLHLIVQIHRASDGRLMVGGTWDVDHDGAACQLRRVLTATSSGGGFTWSESVPAPRIASLLAAWAETGVAFDPGVDAEFWRSAGPSRRQAIGR